MVQLATPVTQWGVPGLTGEANDTPESARTIKAARFAHPTEGEFAALLDYYGVAWQYEPHMFPLREAEGRLLEAFTPDFFLPEHGQYVELTTLKQTHVTDKNRKLRLLRERYPEVRIKLLYRRDCARLLGKYVARAAAVRPALVEILLDEAKLRRIAARLAHRISHDYAGVEPVLLGVMPGAVCFLADIARRLVIPAAMETLTLPPYRGGERRAELPPSLRTAVAGRDVIVVDGLVDSGLSASFICREVARLGAASVVVCALLSREARRVLDVPLTYVGSTLPDVFVAGYGIGQYGEFWNLPFVGALRDGEPAA